MTPISRKPGGSAERAAGVSPALSQAVLDEAFAKSGAAKWGLTADHFRAALERSIGKRFAGCQPNAMEVRSYILGLHLEDLGLACACEKGLSTAWDFFVACYQPYLRAGAAAILRCATGSAAACDLADSLFAELYGLKGAKERGSLFRYFHGRSSLKTWLRTVLAQRHIDGIRASRRFISLDDEADGIGTGGMIAREGVQVGNGETARVAQHAAPLQRAEGPDPDRARYVELFRRTLEVALGLLDTRDKERLRCYYAEQKTLAEIGKELGEHESSVSRNLERTRRELRQEVERALRKGIVAGGGATAQVLSEAQIALCFEYAAEDVPIDFEKIFPAAATVPVKRKGRET